jgi:hypothetical protein
MKKWWFPAVLFIFLAIAGVCIFLYLPWRRSVDGYRRTRFREEALVLYEVSMRTGRIFNDWLTLREYVHCRLLQKGMTHTEIWAALSTVGGLRSEGENVDEADYKDQYLDEYLSPILMVFTRDEYPARLSSWHGSPDVHFSAPKPACESERK